MVPPPLTVVVAVKVPLSSVIESCTPSQSLGSSRSTAHSPSAVAPAPSAARASSSWARSPPAASCCSVASAAASPYRRAARSAPPPRLHFGDVRLDLLHVRLPGIEDDVVAIQE